MLLLCNIDKLFSWQPFTVYCLLDGYAVPLATLKKNRHSPIPFKQDLGFAEKVFPGGRV
jgi:hypothetical protein